MTSRPTETLRSLGTLRMLLLVVVGIVTVDQVSKLLITTHLGLGQSVPVVPGFVHLTLVRNTGMAFGLFSGSDIPYKPLLVTLLSVVAMAAVTYYALSARHSEKMTRTGLMFILGGASGNIIDRVRFGYVVDFIDVFYRDAHWPAFNVADACICIGVGLVVLDALHRREPSLAAEPRQGES